MFENAAVVPEIVKVIASSNLTLVCDFEVSTATVQWTCLGDNQTMLKAGNVLELKQITVRDSGVYRCDAVDLFGDVTTKEFTLDVLSECTLHNFTIYKSNTCLYQFLHVLFMLLIAFKQVCDLK